MKLSMSEWITLQKGMEDASEYRKIRKSIPLARHYARLAKLIEKHRRSLDFTKREQNKS